MIPLEVIGRIDIPESVLSHRFVIEALACAHVLGQNEDSKERVVGTENTKKVELYGWAPNVDCHVDQTGLVYLLALNEGKGTVNCWNENPPTSDDPVSVWMPAGTVVRLNDYMPHWTEDDQCRVCAFLGSFREPCDAAAIALLQESVQALARGDYYGAPRVREGFRALRPDECLVPNDAFDAYEPMLLADAQKQGKWFEPCSECDQPAVRLDNHWPYCTEYNRCAEHLRGAAA